MEQIVVEYREWGGNHWMLVLTCDFKLNNASIIQSEVFLRYWMGKRKITFDCGINNGDVINSAICKSISINHFLFFAYGKSLEISAIVWFKTFHSECTLSRKCSRYNRFQYIIFTTSKVKLAFSYLKWYKNIRWTIS